MIKWKYKFVNTTWVNIWNDILLQTDPKEDRLPFSVQKELVKSFKLFEKSLTIHPKITGWISWTKLEHAHIMLIFGKSGAQPYFIDTKRKHIWFRKILTRS